MADKKPELKPDGKLHPLGDAIEANPEFDEEFDLMSDEFFKENNPGYYALIQRLKKENGAIEDPT